MTTLTVPVRFFAAARERVGKGADLLTLPEGATVRTALDALAARYPNLASLLPHLRVAVDQEFAPDDQPLRDGVELALIPPVAGGAPREVFAIVDRPLALEEVTAAVTTEGHGGVVGFAGTVRNVTRGRAVTRLEYEAYAPMAEKQLRVIAEEAKVKWPGVRVAVVHRVGTLLPGETAVVIGTSAPHRQEAFLACQHVIDRLKQDVPIWKKEFYADGEVWVGLGP